MAEDPDIETDTERAIADAVEAIEKAHRDKTCPHVEPPAPLVRHRKPATHTQQHRG
jgi:hypothetical protein